MTSKNGHTRLNAWISLILCASISYGIFGYYGPMIVAGRRLKEGDWLSAMSIVRRVTKAVPRQLWPVLRGVPQPDQFALEVLNSRREPLRNQLMKEALERRPGEESRTRLQLENAANLILGSNVVHEAFLSIKQDAADELLRSSTSPQANLLPLDRARQMRAAAELMGENAASNKVFAAIMEEVVQAQFVVHAQTAQDLSDAYILAAVTDLESHLGTWLPAMERAPYLRMLRERLNQLVSYRQARAGYEQALAQTNVLTLVQHYGGKDWVAAQSNATKGAANMIHPAVGRLAYIDALGALEDAVSAASRELAKRKFDAAILLSQKALKRSLNYDPAIKMTVIDGLQQSLKAIDDLGRPVISRLMADELSALQRTKNELSEALIRTTTKMDEEPVSQPSGGTPQTIQNSSAATAPTLPLRLYDECSNRSLSPFHPTGLMGSTEAIQYNDCWLSRPHTGASCIRVAFSDPPGWGGIAWQNPANNWGDDDGGVDLTGAKRLSFWARGENGGEQVEFKMGVIAGNRPFHDSCRASLGKITLSTTWQRYEIDLSGKDLSQVITGFVFTLRGSRNPVVFYLDDIQYE